MMIDPSVTEWAERAGLAYRADDDAGVHVWMDLDSAYRLSSVPAGFEVSERGRGSFEPSARLRTSTDAEKFMLLLIAMPWRSQRGLPGLLPSGLASGADLRPAGGGHELTWSGGSGWFRRPSDARRFSHVTALDLRELSRALASS